MKLNSELVNWQNNISLSSNSTNEKIDKGIFSVHSYCEVNFCGIQDMVSLPLNILYVTHNTIVDIMLNTSLSLLIFLLQFSTNL